MLPAANFSDTKSHDVIQTPVRPPCNRTWFSSLGIMKIIKSEKKQKKERQNRYQPVKSAKHYQALQLGHITAAVMY
jgi:hypothetical protein